jgi:hypothetical protein
MCSPPRVSPTLSTAASCASVAATGVAPFRTLISPHMASDGVDELGPIDQALEALIGIDDRDGGAGLADDAPNLVLGAGGRRAIDPGGFRMLPSR